jgi:hypothetical protein
MMNKIPWLAFLLCLLACCAAAQTFEDSAAIDPSQNRAGQTNVKPDVYVLGPDDASSPCGPRKDAWRWLWRRWS